MSLQTADDFLAILEKSKLVSPNGLQQIRKATVEVADAKSVAKFLVSRGILTRFQATQLLAGRHALQLGPYRLLDRIASSGTGAVYAAQAAETKQPVSLKVLPRKLLEDKETLTKLKQQVGKLKSLDHPAFCRAIELRREGDQVVLVLEAVDGESLAQRVQTGGPLAFDTAGKYVRQVADALAAAHQQELVHGDLTPHNLICDAQDQLKLIDVGTATLNPAGVSADYAAPEVSAGQPPAPASDVYSLGCTLYFLLTGKPPFPEGTAEEKRQKHASELPAGVLELRPDAPPELMKLCIRMMAKKPEQRPELAGAVVGAIDEWLTAAAASPADEAGGDDAGQGELTETSDNEVTDPDVDRALAEAMAASDFDEHLDEPASEATPPAAAVAAPAKGPANDVDDVLAEAMAASEFDHSMEDAEQSDQRKARLGDVSGSDDDLMDDPDDDYEAESPAAPAPAAADSAVATGGPKLLGLDLYRLLGVKADDEPAAKKKKLIIGGVASGVIALGLVFAVVKFGLPMVFGDSGKSTRRRSSGSSQVTQRDNRPPKKDTDPQPASGEPKQPAETVVEGPGDGTLPGETAPGETTPEGGGTGTGAAEEGGGTKTPPDRTGDGRGEPGEETGTTPAEPPGTTPAEPPGEVVNPLEGLAARIELPREAGAGSVSLGPLKISPETACAAEFVGATETGIDAGVFTLKPTEIPQADRAWFVEMSSAGAAPVTIGGFIVKDGELTYQWNGENATNEPAQSLRYLALKLTCGSHEHVVALRTPRVEKPIVAEFDRDNMTAFVDVDWQGDPQLLFAQITELEGKFPGHEFKGGKSTVKAGGDKTVLMIGEGDPPMLAVMVDASLTDKLSLVLTPFFRLESEQKTLPFNSSTVNLWGNKLLKSLAEEKESLGTAKKREAETRGTQAERLREVIRQSEEKIAATEESLAPLKKLSEFAKATHKQGKIHFRVFYKLDDSEVDLVQTQE